MLKAIIVVVAYVFTIFVGSSIVEAICRRFKLEALEAKGIKGAGKYIGYFERFLILTFTLLNQYTAMALVLTAKSIARFEALRERKFAEYYLMATLCSVSIAIFIGILLRLFLT